MNQCFVCGITKEEGAPITLLKWIRFGNVSAITVTKKRKRACSALCLDCIRDIKRIPFSMLPKTGDVPF